MEISKAEHLKRQRSSGLTIRAYAERAGIPVSRLYGWLKDERRKKCADSGGTFVRVSSEPTAPIEVCLHNGIVLKVPTAVEAGALQRLVEALNACAR